MTNLVRCTATPAGLTRLGGRRYRVRASTPRVDAMGDTIDQLAWEIEGEVPLLLGHDYSKLEIGVVHVDRISPDGLDVIVEFLPAGLSAEADDVVRRIDAGYPPRFSVGFQPTKHPVPNKSGGRHYAGQKLMELSVVSVPANSDAKLVGAVRSLDRAPIAAWLTSKGVRPGSVPPPPAPTGGTMWREIRGTAGCHPAMTLGTARPLLAAISGPRLPINRSSEPGSVSKAEIAARVQQGIRNELAVRAYQLRNELYGAQREAEQKARRSW